MTKKKIKEDVKKRPISVEKDAFGEHLKTEYEYDVFIQILIFLFNFQGVPQKCHEFFNIYNLSYPWSQYLQKKSFYLHLLGHGPFLMSSFINGKLKD